jgi:hypothetical protein
VSALEFLPCRPEQDLVHVYIVGLTDGEGHHPRERHGRQSGLRDELANVRRDVGFGDAVREFRSQSARREVVSS